MRPAVSRTTAAGAPWWALAALAPALLLLLAAAGGPGSAPGVIARAVFAPFCHQDPARTIAVNGQLLPVCARCTGFYGGLALLTLAALAVRAAGILRRVGRPVLLLLLPLVVDGGANLLGLWHTPPALRLGIGAVAALPVALLLVGERHAAY